VIAGAHAQAGAEVGLRKLGTHLTRPVDGLDQRPHFGDPRSASPALPGLAASQAGRAWKAWPRAPPKKLVARSPGG
jgi:hypothetical protein